MRRGWRAVGRGGAAVLVGLLAACAEPSPAPQAVVEPAAPISDPVVAFAAAASPGAEDTVVLPETGQSARVRLVRAYAAASGRECREVLVRAGGGSRSRLLCRAGEGWREARPLISGGSDGP